MTWDASSIEKRGDILLEFGIDERGSYWEKDSRGKLCILKLLFHPDDVMMAESLLAQMDFDFIESDDSYEVEAIEARA